MFTCIYEITLILPVLVIHNHNRAAKPNVLQGFRYAAELAGWDGGWREGAARVHACLCPVLSRQVTVTAAVAAAAAAYWRRMLSCWLG